MTEDKMRKRIEELEEALKYYADTFCELGPYHECCGRLTSDECSGCRAASLLSQTETPVEESNLQKVQEITPTPPQTHGDVERVNQIRKALKAAHEDGATLSATPASIMAIYDDGYDRICAIDELVLLSAMRPVSVDREKLKEIRERHEDIKNSGWFDRVGSTAKEAHADREWLLSAIDGGNDD